MTRIGCSLLFPSDSEFQFELVEFEGKHPDGPQAGIGGRNGYLLVFRAKSTHSKTLEVPCVIACKCLFTKDCLKEFTQIHLPRKEQEKRQRACYSELTWPGLISQLTCPTCARKAKVGETYYLVFYTMLQYLSSAMPHVLAARVSARFVCINCMNSMVRMKVPKNSELLAGPNFPVRAYLDSCETTVPIFMRNGRVIAIKDVKRASPLHTHFVMGFMPSMETLFCEEIREKGGKLLQELVSGSCVIPTYYHNSKASRKEVKKTLKEVRKKGRCWVCKKEGADESCSLCHKPYYCSRSCQVIDWKRHKISECVPILPLDERKYA